MSGDTDAESGVRYSGEVKDPILLGWIGALCVLWVIDYLRGRK